MNGRRKPSKFPWSYFFLSIIPLIVISVALGSLIRGCTRNGSTKHAQDSSVSAYEKIRGEMQAALVKNPGNQPARFRLAEALFYLGDVQDALDEIGDMESSGKKPEGLSKLISAITEYGEMWDKAGQLYAESLHSSEPSEFFPAILGICSDVVENYDGVLAQRAHFLKAHLLLREGRKTEALWAIEPILGKFENLNDYCQYYYARGLATSENREGALEEFDKLLAHFPASRIAPLGLLEEVNILRDEGKLDDAKAKALLLLDQFPDSTFVPIAYRKVAEIYGERGENDKALHQRYRIVDEFPDGEEGRIALVSIRETDPGFQNFAPEQKLRLLQVSVDKGYYDFAEPLLEHLRDTYPNDGNLGAGALYQLARIYYHRDSLSKCITTAKKAYDINHSGQWAGKSLNRMAHAYKNKGSLLKAINYYDSVSEDYSSLAPYALYNAGGILISKGLLSDASRRFKELVEDFPDSGETEAAYKQLFILAYRRGDYDAVRKYTGELIKRYPDGELASAAYYWRAKALTELGKDNDAGSEFEYLTEHFQRSYYGIRAMEVLGFAEDEITRLVFLSGPDERGKDDNKHTTPRLIQAHELLQTNIFDLALDEFATVGANKPLEAYVTEVRNAYLGDDWHKSYKEARNFFSRGYGNLLNGKDFTDMLTMGFPSGYQDEINDAASRYGLDPSMLNGIILQESTFRAKVVSPSDAIGLMQVIPSTGRYIAHLKGFRSFDSSSLFDVETNIDYGTFYLNYLLKDFDGDLIMTLIAYNGGPGNARTWRSRYYRGDVDLFIETIPAAETRDFVKYVYANIRVYQAKAARMNIGTN